MSATTLRIVIGRPGDPGLTAGLLTQMFRLRYEVFHRRLGWEVDGSGGIERDEFDGLDPVYGIALSGSDKPLGGPENSVVGCVRLLPTMGPHMLRDVAAFRPALRGRSAPCGPRLWEISRLATAPQEKVGPAFPPDTDGLGPVARALLAAAGAYAQRHGIERFVALSSAVLERKANASGIPTTRIGEGVTLIGTVPCTTYCVTATALTALA